MEIILRYSLVLSLIGLSVSAINKGRIIRSPHHPQVGHDSSRPQHFHSASAWQGQGGFSQIPPPHHHRPPIYPPQQPNYPSFSSSSSSFASSQSGSNFGPSSSQSGDNFRPPSSSFPSWNQNYPNFGRPPAPSTSFASSSSQSGPGFGHAQSESGSINFGPLQATFSKSVSTSSGK